MDTLVSLMDLECDGLVFDYYDKNRNVRSSDETKIMRRYKYE